MANKAVILACNDGPLDCGASSAMVAMRNTKNSCSASTAKSSSSSQRSSGFMGYARRCC